MKKNLILFVLAVLIIIVGIKVFGFTSQKPSADSNSLELAIKKDIKPSETFIEYSDETGFKFNYPDNLSIVKNEIKDNSTYADLQLNSKDISGSLSLKIADSKFKSLNEWLKSNKIATSSASVRNLGNLKALEVKTSDRLMLGAIDQGILFTIEMPLLEEEFWTKVYDKLLTDFSFSTPQNTTAASNDVSFEGEEVVE